MTEQGLLTAADRPIAAVCAEILDDIVRTHSERRERLRLDRLLHRTDRLLEELEQLNLREVDRLPTKLRTKLGPLFSDLPFAFEPTISESPTPLEVLDIIFELQEVILALKTDGPLEELDDGEAVGPQSKAS